LDHAATVASRAGTAAGAAQGPGYAHYALAARALTHAAALAERLPAGREGDTAWGMGVSGILAGATVREAVAGPTPLPADPTALRTLLERDGTRVGAHDLLC
jgi:hypothetical protein